MMSSGSARTDQSSPKRRSLLKPEDDLRRAERDAARTAISFVDDLVARYEPREAEEFLRALHEQVVDLWSQLEAAHPSDSLGDLESVPGADDMAAPKMTAAERAERVRRLLTRRFERRRNLIAESLTAPQVAGMLGVSRQASHDRRRAGRLLAVPVGKLWLFPAWQFDPDAPDSVLPGLATVLRALNNLSPLEQWAWLRTPKPAFDGRAPVELMRGGDVDRVVALARGAGVA
jgi:hypothetical protein